MPNIIRGILKYIKKAGADSPKDKNNKRKIEYGFRAKALSGNSSGRQKRSNAESNHKHEAVRIYGSRPDSTNYWMHNLVHGSQLTVHIRFQYRIPKEYGAYGNCAVGYIENRPNLKIKEIYDIAEQ